MGRSTQKSRAASRINMAIGLKRLTEIRQSAVDTYNASPRLCAFCSTALTYKKRRHSCCSKRCSNRWIAKRSARIAACLNCGAPVKGTRRKYCNNKCQQAFQASEILERWFAGANGHGSALSLSPTIRTFLLRKSEYKCSECGWGKLHPVTGRSPLNIDHIDGDHTNTRPDNLRVLCPNCHSLTSNFGSLNKGRGRARRLIEYERTKAAIAAIRDKQSVA